MLVWYYHYDKILSTCRASQANDLLKLGRDHATGTARAVSNLRALGVTTASIPGSPGSRPGPRTGVVQKPPFLGYTRRAETAGL